MKIPKRNEELVKAEFEINGFTGGLNMSKNVVIDDEGTISKRTGYNTFGEMVHVLWKINKQYKKNGYKGEFTVTLPLKGTKPVYKKTLEKTN